MQRSASCRSRRELSNAYFVAKFGFDTAENEPCKVQAAELQAAARPRRRAPTSDRHPERDRGSESSLLFHSNSNCEINSAIADPELYLEVRKINPSLPDSFENFVKQVLATNSFSKKSVRRNLWKRALASGMREAKLEAWQKIQQRSRENELPK